MFGGTNSIQTNKRKDKLALLVKACVTALLYLKVQVKEKHCKEFDNTKVSPV